MAVATAPGTEMTETTYRNRSKAHQEWAKTVQVGHLVEYKGGEDEVDGISVTEAGVIRFHLMELDREVSYEYCQDAPMQYGEQELPEGFGEQAIKDAIKILNPVVDVDPVSEPVGTPEPREQESIESIIDRLQGSSKSDKIRALWAAGYKRTEIAKATNAIYQLVHTVTRKMDEAGHDHVLDGGACEICHRALRDAVSIARGIGPICFSKLKSELGEAIDLVGAHEGEDEDEDETAF